MRDSVLTSALTLMCYLAMPTAALAKGPGGHGSGGHGGGGHSGGHASGGHSGGQTQGGRATGKGTSRGTSKTGSSGSESGPAQPSGPRPPIRTPVPWWRGTAPPRAYFPSSLWPYYGSALGLGLGMGLYDVYDDPYLSGGANGYPSAYRYDPAWASPPAPDGLAPYPFDARGPTGGLRLRVEPKDAQVFVDGYYAGLVDEFDGHFQHLDLVPGPHHVEVYMPGYERLLLDVIIQPHHTIQYQGRLRPTAR